MTRLPGWRKRLVETIDRFRREPFRFGSADCAVLAAAAAVAITGRNPLPNAWRGYSDERQALALMINAGFANLADMTGSVLTEIHPSAAVSGDIAAITVDNPFGFGLGVVSGDRIFVFGKDYDGLGHVDLLIASRAFQVS